MVFIIKSLLVGNIYEAQAPPPFVNAVLWAALEPHIIPPSGIAFGQIPLQEYIEADPIDLETGVDWIDRHLPTHRVLVCCRAGMGRSVSLVTAYLCCVKGMPYQEAIHFIRSRCPGATPLPNLENTIAAVQEMRHDPPKPAKLELRETKGTMQIEKCKMTGKSPIPQ